MGDFLDIVNRALNDGTLFYVLIGLVVAVPLLQGIVRGLRGGPAPERFSPAQSIAEPAPGSPLYERHESVRPMLQRRGFTFRYWFYIHEDGTAFWIHQSKVLGGPFQLLKGALTEVYEGEQNGVRITLGSLTQGISTSRRRIHREEHMAAVVTLAGSNLPTFTVAPRAHRAGRHGRKLSFPTHPQLATTHHIRGHETARLVLSGELLDFLAEDPEWAIEGRDNRLIVIRTSLAPNSEWLSPRDVNAFLDGMLRIAGTFGVRWSSRPANP